MYKNVAVRHFQSNGCCCEGKREQPLKKSTREEVFACPYAMMVT
jgi:hypothetical protein